MGAGRRSVQRVRPRRHLRHRRRSAARPLLQLRHRRLHDAGAADLELHPRARALLGLDDRRAAHAALLRVGRARGVAADAVAVARRGDARGRARSRPRREEGAKYYRYHHFNDNCTTRIRDVLDRATGGRLSRDRDRSRQELPPVGARRLRRRLAAARRRRAAARALRRSAHRLVAGDVPAVGAARGGGASASTRRPSPSSPGGRVRRRARPGSAPRPSPSPARCWRSSSSRTCAPVAR